MTQKRPLSEQSDHDVRRYRAYALARRLFAAMDDADDREEAEKTFKGEGLEELARDVVDALAILFRGADGRSPARIAVVFAEAMIRRARPDDDATFAGAELVLHAAETMDRVATRAFPGYENLGAEAKKLATLLRGFEEEARGYLR